MASTAPLIFYCKTPAGGKVPVPTKFRLRKCTEFRGISQNFANFGLFWFVQNSSVCFGCFDTGAKHRKKQNFSLGFTIQIKKQPLPQKLLFEPYSRK
jgi:hypothetical protein